MKVTITLPKTDFNNIGKKNCPVELEVELKQQDGEEIIRCIWQRNIYRVFKIGGRLIWTKTN